MSLVVVVMVGAGGGHLQVALRGGGVREAGRHREQEVVREGLLGLKERQRDEYIVHNIAKADG